MTLIWQADRLIQKIGNIKVQESIKEVRGTEKGNPSPKTGRSQNIGNPETHEIKKDRMP